LSIFETKYWDNFSGRKDETIIAVKNNTVPPLRRLSVHITEKCNMFCKYCNEKKKAKTLPIELALKAIREFAEIGGGIIHITGGEPTTVSYLRDLATFTERFRNIDLHLNSNFLDISNIMDVLYIFKRIKVSLDTCNELDFDSTTCVRRSFKNVISNLRYLHDNIILDGHPVVSITNTVTRKNYKTIPAFLDFYYKNFPAFYAVFFSSYKGRNTEFEFSKDDIEILFNDIVPVMDMKMSKNKDTESKLLFHSSHDKKTFSCCDRFPENKYTRCYIQLSEMLIDSIGDIYNCSHLFRDGRGKTGLNICDDHIGILHKISKNNQSNIPISDKCLYGCNKKLVSFNEAVESYLATPLTKAHS